MVSHKIIPVGAYEANCVILWVGEDALVLDPGQDSELLLAFLSGRNLRLRAILLTHGHFDHVNGIPGILEKNPDVPVYAHPSDWVMFGHPMNRNPPDYPGVGTPVNLHDIRDIVKDFPSFGFEVLETPGHTPGSVCVKTGTLLLSGDTLFAGSCGRTDFPGGSMADMRRSLASLAKLPPETEVVPGHGPSTTIAREVASNPFIER
ncbi:MAG: MBL fold metallo-hydrolase [Kiritimatiellae bacterium]|nr:MBL fold metallo-hydrolase [Kiritimatiellia bacterium]